MSNFLATSCWKGVVMGGQKGRVMVKQGNKVWDHQSHNGIYPGPKGEDFFLRELKKCSLDPDFEQSLEPITGVLDVWKEPAIFL